MARSLGCKHYEYEWWQWSGNGMAVNIKWEAKASSAVHIRRIRSSRPLEKDRITLARAECSVLLNQKQFTDVQMPKSCCRPSQTPGYTLHTLPCASSPRRSARRPPAAGSRPRGRRLAAGPGAASSSSPRTECSDEKSTKKGQPFCLLISVGVCSGGPGPGRLGWRA